MKFVIIAFVCIIAQCLAVSMDMRAKTIQLIEEVYNRKDAVALEKFFSKDSIYRDNIYSGRIREIRGLERIRDLHLLQRCPLFNMVGSVFTIEDSVVNTQSKTIRYVLAVHGAMLNSYKNDVLRLSVLHRFDEDGKNIILTEIFGDMTSIRSRLNRNRLPESEVNRMKAQRISEVFNTRRNYHVLDDLMSKNIKVYLPENQGKSPINWESAVKLQLAHDKCFTNQMNKVVYVMHEQSRPEEVALIWKWKGTFSSPCPGPYSQKKPTGKEITTCGISEYKFCRETGQITAIRVTYDVEDILRQMDGKEPSAVSNSCSSSSSSRDMKTNDFLLTTSL